MPTYNRSDVAFERGEGAYLFGTDGRRYLDFASGIAVTALGHAHPHLIEALTEQAQKIWHCSNIFTIPQQQRLAERMIANSFADTVFFCNSGAEAVECGIKTIRKYHHVTGNPQKKWIIACDDSFHGRTIATIFAAGQQKLIEGFDPVVPGFKHVPFGNLNEMRAAVSDEIGGILVEPIVGEGGYKAADPDFIKGLRAICDEFGLLLMFDEVQCGNGRTGKYWAHEWFGVTPDVMATAKGMGGGFPVGACLATEAAAQGMTAGSHGSTYGGNPLAMAVGNAVLDILLEPGFLEHVQRVGDYFGETLATLVAQFPGVFTEVRGMGLMRGIRCAEGVTNTDMVASLRDAGFLAVGAGQNVIRMAPPLIIEESHVDEAAGYLSEAAAALPKAAE